MWRFTRNSRSRLAPLLALVAVLFAGGGIAQFAHIMLEHRGATPCAAHAETCSIPSDGSHSKQHDKQHAPSADHCAKCALLATNLLAPTAFDPFSDVISMVALVDEREAAQLPAPRCPRICAARPPPQFS